MKYFVLTFLLFCSLFLARKQIRKMLKMLKRNN